jgi:hypothetical protein
MKYSVLSLTMCLVIASGITTQAVTNCRVVEYPDHVEAICDGNEQSVPAASTPSATSTPGAVTTPNATAVPNAASPNPSLSKKKTAVKSESLKRLLDYRLKRPTKTGWNEKLALRMKLIKEGQRNESRETVPETDPMGGAASDAPVVPDQQSEAPAPTTNTY